MCFVPQKNLLFLLFHHCPLVLFCIRQNTTPTLFSILSKATNILQSRTKYFRVLSDTVTFQDAIVLHLHHQENLFPHPLCTRTHWTAAGALGAQGEAEMSSISKTIK